MTPDNQSVEIQLRNYVSNQNEEFHIYLCNSTTESIVNKESDRLCLTHITIVDYTTMGKSDLLIYNNSFQTILMSSFKGKDQGISKKVANYTSSRYYDYDWE